MNMCDVIEKYCECGSYAISLHNPIGKLGVSVVLFEKVFCPKCITPKIKYGATESGRVIPKHSVFSKTLNGWFGILYNEKYIRREAPAYFNLEGNPGEHLAVDMYGFNGEVDGEAKNRFWKRVITIVPEKMEPIRKLSA